MNVQLTHAADGLKRRAFTVSDVLRMVDAGILGHDERFELIGGEIVPMSPKGIRHERVKQWMMEALVRGLPDHLQTIPETTIYLSDDTFIKPDFVVYPAASGLENLSPSTCRLAIEIGASSLAYDLGRKAMIYAQFAIGEMWVIDVNEPRIITHRTPVDGAYRDITTHSADAVLAPAGCGGFELDSSKAPWG